MSRDIRHLISILTPLEYDMTTIAADSRFVTNNRTLDENEWKRERIQRAVASFVDKQKRERSVAVLRLCSDFIQRANKNKQ